MYLLNKQIYLHDASFFIFSEGKGSLEECLEMCMLLETQTGSGRNARGPKPVHW